MIEIYRIKVRFIKIISFSSSKVTNFREGLVSGFVGYCISKLNALRKRVLKKHFSNNCANLMFLNYIAMIT